MEELAQARFVAHSYEHMVRSVTRNQAV